MIIRIVNISANSQSFIFTGVLPLMTREPSRRLWTLHWAKTFWMQKQSLSLYIYIYVYAYIFIRNAYSNKIMHHNNSDGDHNKDAGDDNN